jgi:hypothetical protein
MGSRKNDTRPALIREVQVSSPGRPARPLPSRSRSRVASSVRKRVPVRIRPRAQRGCSSAGRAPPRHGGGHGFEARYPLPVHAVLAQLAEAPRSGRGWSGFESLGRYGACRMESEPVRGRASLLTRAHHTVWDSSSPLSAPGCAIRLATEPGPNPGELDRLAGSTPAASAGHDPAGRRGPSDKRVWRGSTPRWPTGR